MVFQNYDKVGIELDKVFNAHNDKAREGEEGVKMAFAHGATKNNRSEEQESTKEASQKSCKRHNWKKMDYK